MSQLIETIPLKSSQWSLVASSARGLRHYEELPDVSINVRLDDKGRLSFELTVEGKHTTQYSNNNSLSGYYEKIEHFWAGFLQGCIYEKTRKR